MKKLSDNNSILTAIQTGKDMVENCKKMLLHFQSTNKEEIFKVIGLYDQAETEALPFFRDKVKLLKGSKEQISYLFKLRQDFYVFMCEFLQSYSQHFSENIELYPNRPKTYFDLVKKCKQIDGLIMEDQFGLTKELQQVMIAIFQRLLEHKCEDLDLPVLLFNKNKNDIYNMILRLLNSYCLEQVDIIFSRKNKKQQTDTLTDVLKKISMTLDAFEFSDQNISLLSTFPNDRYLFYFLASVCLLNLNILALCPNKFLIEDSGSISLWISQINSFCDKVNEHIENLLKIYFKLQKEIKAADTEIMLTLSQQLNLTIEKIYKNLQIVIKNAVKYSKTVGDVAFHQNLQEKIERWLELCLSNRVKFGTFVLDGNKLGSSKNDFSSQKALYDEDSQYRKKILPAVYCVLKAAAEFSGQEEFNTFSKQQELFAKLKDVKEILIDKKLNQYFYQINNNFFKGFLIYFKNLEDALDNLASMITDDLIRRELFKKNDYSTILLCKEVSQQKMMKLNLCFANNVCAVVNDIHQAILQHKNFHLACKSHQIHLNKHSPVRQENIIKEMLRKVDDAIYFRRFPVKNKRKKTKKTKTKRKQSTATTMKRKLQLPKTVSSGKQKPESVISPQVKKAEAISTPSYADIVRRANVNKPHSKPCSEKENIAKGLKM